MDIYTHEHKRKKERVYFTKCSQNCDNAPAHN